MTRNSPQPASLDDHAGAARPDLLRRLNRSRLIEAIRGAGPLTRAALARRTGMSYPTVLKVASELMDDGLLDEGELVQASQGRPGKALGMATRSSRIASIIVGVEACTVAEARLDGTLVKAAEVCFASPDSYQDLLEGIGAALSTLADARPADCRLIGVGMSVPGVINHERGAVVISPNLPWLMGQPLVADVENLSALPVAMVRSMHAHYLAAAAFGEGRGIADFVVVNFAGGIGMGVCAGGRFIDGHGGTSGELGHLPVVPEGRLCGCGSRGCLETIASDRAVVEAASERHGGALTMDEVIALCRSGELEIDDILNQAADFLAVGIASAINLFNPRRVLLYGHFLAARDDLFDRFAAAAKARALAPSAADVEILPPDRHPHRHQQIGAAAAVIDELVAGRCGRGEPPPAHPPDPLMVASSVP